MKLKTLDLFSGLGGFSLGLERTGCFKTIAFCDNNKFSKLILDKHWKGIKIYDDIREITKEKFKTDGIEFPDIITGGFPCQPFSVAGKQKGTSDDRHLWPEMFRIIKAFKPRFVIGENVRGIINIQDGVVFEAVCTDLESEGYEVQPFIIPAAGVGAPHRRERVWIIAIREESMVNSDNIRFEQHNETEEEASRRRSSATFEPTGDVPNTNESNSRERKVSRDIDNEGRRASETRGESLQSEDRKTRTDNSGSSSEDVANAQSERTRKNDKGLWSRTSGISGGQRTDQDVGNTKLQRLQGRQRNDKREGRQILSSEQHDRREIRSEIGCSSGVSRQEDVADTESFSSHVRGRGEYQKERDGQRKIRGEGSEDVADTERIGQSRSRKPIGSSNTETNQIRQTSRLNDGSQGTQGWWESEPDVGRVAHGVSGRVHRLRALGNSIIPQIAEEIGRAIIKAMNKV